MKEREREKLEIILNSYNLKGNFIRFKLKRENMSWIKKILIKKNTSLKPYKENQMKID